jgi:hypothetical protein
MENEFMKRGYLLPDGCKDLMDVLKPKEAKPVIFNPSAFETLKDWAEAEAIKGLKSLAKDPTAFMEAYYAGIEKMLAAQPPIKEEIIIPKQMSVHQLGQLLTEKSYKSGNLEKEGCEVGMISYKPYAPLVFRDLVKMGFVKNSDDIVDFETVSKVLAKYGVTCKLADP